MVDEKYANQNEFLIDEPEYLTKDMTRRKRRKQNFRKAIRKERITRKIYHTKPLKESGWHYYESLNQYSKNKIHCSCPMCSEKTNTKKNKGKGYGKRGKRENDMWITPPIQKYDDNGNIEVIIPGKPKKNRNSGYWVTNERNGKNWSMQDKKRIQAMEEELIEYNL